MRNYILLFILCSMSFVLPAQQIERELISSFGSMYQDAHLQLESSVGENFCSTINNGEILLTQGFHQSGMYLLSETKDLHVEAFNIYPNPFANILHFEFQEDEGEMEIQILDMNGRYVANETLAKTRNTETSLNLHYLNPGVYTITAKTKQGILTNKIIKL